MMSESIASRDTNKFIVRMPDGMRPWISDEARRNCRSANAQIVWMLQQMIDRIKEEAAKPIS